MRLLLGSGGLSTPERQKAWKDELGDFLGPLRSLLFIPHALADHDAYLKGMTDRGFSAGRELTGLHQVKDPITAIREAKAVYVGGGNSFRLLHSLYELRVMSELHLRVRS